MQLNSTPDAPLGTGKMLDPPSEDIVDWVKSTQLFAYGDTVDGDKLRECLEEARQSSWGMINWIRYMGSGDVGPVGFAPEDCREAISTFIARCLYILQMDGLWEDRMLKNALQVLAEKIVNLSMILVHTSSMLWLPREDSDRLIDARECANDLLHLDNDETLDEAVRRVLCRGQQTMQTTKFPVARDLSGLRPLLHAFWQFVAMRNSIIQRIYELPSDDDFREYRILKPELDDELFS